MDNDKYSVAMPRHSSGQRTNSRATYSKRTHTKCRSPAKQKIKRSGQYKKLDAPIAILNDDSKQQTATEVLRNNENAQGDKLRKWKAISRPFKQVFFSARSVLYFSTISAVLVKVLPPKGVLRS